MPTVKFTFESAPPSLNGSTAVMNGRKIKSKQYRDWLADEMINLNDQPKGIGAAPSYWSSIILIPPRSSRADIDNLAKAIHDVLVKSGKTPDDAYLVQFSMRYYSGGKVAAIVKNERLDGWIPVMMPTRVLRKKLEAGDIENGKIC